MHIQKSTMNHKYLIWTFMPKLRGNTFLTLFELNVIFEDTKDRTSGQGHTIHVFIEDEVEKLNKSIVVLIQEDAGNAGVHFFH